MQIPSDSAEQRGRDFQQRYGGAKINCGKWVLFADKRVVSHSFIASLRQMLGKRNVTAVLMTTFIIAGGCLLFDAAVKTALGVLLVGCAVAWGVASRPVNEQSKDAYPPSASPAETQPKGPGRYCVLCGTSNPKNARYCCKCGGQVEVTDEETSKPCDAEATCVAEGKTAAHQPEWQDDETVAIARWRASRTEYAGLVERLLAYLCDLPVVCLIILIAEFMWGFAEGLGLTHVNISENQWRMFFYPVLACYMTLSVFFTRTTIGKCLFGLEVASTIEGNPATRPSLGRIILRETVGRVLSSLFFGIGYWSVPRDPRGQARSDKMGRTVVRRRAVRPSVRRSLAALVCLAFIADVTEYSLAQGIQNKQAIHQEWKAKLDDSSARVKSARDAVNRLMNSSSDSFSKLQDDMRGVLDAVEVYNKELDGFEDICRKGLRDNLASDDREKNQMSSLIAIMELRRQQVQIQRSQAEFIVSFDPRSGDRVALKVALASLDRRIDDLNGQAASTISQSGMGQF